MKKSKQILSAPKFIIFILFMVFVIVIDVCVIAGADKYRILGLFGLSDFSHSADGYDLSVHFIDVGKSDSVFISFGETSILIDTGCASLDGTAKKYIEHYGAEKLDLVIAAYTDPDHLGDIGSIAEKIPIKKLLLSEYDHALTDPKAAEIYQQLKLYDIKTEHTEAGKTYRFGELSLEILSPCKDYDSRNNNSLAVRLAYKDVSFLFAGNALKTAERDMIQNYPKKINSDVLLLSHSGGNEATTQEFLDAVSPVYVIISASEYDLYHPHRDVIDRIEGTGAKLLRTDKDGTIIVATNGDDLKFFLSGKNC